MPASEGNSHRGAWGHVMCHPAKDGHPAKVGMAVGLGMARHPKHPAKRQKDGIDGMAGPKTMGIRMGWISLLHSLWSTSIVHLLYRLILVILFQ